MLVTKKMLIALTLVGALMGAGLGALVTHSSQGTSAASTDTGYEATPTAKADTRTPEQIAATNTAQFATTAEQNAYRQGFDEGYANCANNGANASRRTVGWAQLPPTQPCIDPSASTTARSPGRPTRGNRSTSGSPSTRPTSTSGTRTSSIAWSR